MYREHNKERLKQSRNTYIENNKEIKTEYDKQTRGTNKDKKYEKSYVIHAEVEFQGMVCRHIRKRQSVLKMK